MGLQLAHSQLLGLRQLAEYGRPQLVVALHACEVKLRLGLSVEDGVHEVVFAFECSADHRVILTLVSDRRLRHGTQGFAAGGSGAVGGPDLHVVGHVEETLHRAVELTRRRLHHAFDFGRRFEQIGTTQVVHKCEVAGYNAHRLRSASALVGDRKGEVLGRVARRMNGLNLDVADREGVAVVKQLGIVRAAALFRLFDPLVLPVVGALVGEVQLCIEALGKLTGARQEVGVDVRLRNGHNFNALFFGELQVLVDVALGVDDKRFTGLLAANEVRVLSEFGIENLTE